MILILFFLTLYCLCAELIKVPKFYEVILPVNCDNLLGSKSFLVVTL